MKRFVSAVLAMTMQCVLNPLGMLQRHFLPNTLHRIILICVFLFLVRASHGTSKND